MRSQCSLRHPAHLAQLPHLPMPEATADLASPPAAQAQSQAELRRVRRRAVETVILLATVNRTVALAPLSAPLRTARPDRDSYPNGTRLAMRGSAELSAATHLAQYSPTRPSRAGVGQMNPYCELTSVSSQCHKGGD